MLEANFNLIRIDAMAVNGWVVHAITFIHDDSQGVVMFSRLRVDDPNTTFGTAAFSLPDDTINDKVLFSLGHYDMDEREARSDFAKRTERGF